MRRMILALVVSPLIAQPPSQPPSHPPRYPIPPGGPTQANQDSPIVLAARECVQKHLAILRIESVLEARTQRAAGYNVTLVCRVIEEDGKGTWEFGARRLLSGQWRFQSACRTGD